MSITWFEEMSKNIKTCQNMSVETEFDADFNQVIPVEIRQLFTFPPSHKLNKNPHKLSLEWIVRLKSLLKKQGLKLCFKSIDIFLDDNEPVWQDILKMIQGISDMKGVVKA